MDNSSPTQPNQSRPPVGAPFAYQTRILERTSSRSGGGGLSRHNSQSSISLLTNNTGSSSGSAVPRRWTPSHRPTSSLGGVRGRWEELSRGESASEDQHASPSSLSRESARAKTPTPTSTGTSTGSSSSSDSHFKHDRDRPLTPSSVGSTREPYVTPKYLKRQTMPAPIITSPLSPNSTGIMVEADSHLSLTPQRIHIPIHDSPTKEPSWKTEIAEARAKLSNGSSYPHSSPPAGRFDALERKPALTRTEMPEARPKSSHGSSYSPSSSRMDNLERKSVPLSSGSNTNTPSSSVYNRILRAQTLDSATPHWTPTRPRSESSSRVNLSSPDAPKSISKVLSPEPAETPRNTQPFSSTRPRSESSSRVNVSSSDASKSISKVLSSEPIESSRITQPSPTKVTPRRPTSMSGPLYSLEVTPAEKPTTSPSPSSVMHPSPYRSSYMSNKKAGTYGDVLSVTGRRKLGNHLPRIASGDADDSWVAEPPAVVKKDVVVEERKQKQKPDDPRPRRLDRAARLLRERDANIDFQKITPSAILTGDAGVTGMPGRISLKAPTLAAPSPASRYLGGSWVDKQRHLLQAYEYLCHVGEAQQWIEGCLDEELGFGVVEMEDRLRNGVVLARLVRVFHGEASVKRIIEDTKRDFLYSDNINHFLNFLRNVGLPEGFIFELTDLYAKKNLPKVIYCIHALSHLLARRGMAARIGNLLGQLEFSDDQLQQTQKGLKEAGVAMPNFGNVGRELAKEINEEPEEEQETEEERRQREAQEEAERRDRELLKNVASIIALQSQIRGHFARKRFAAFQARIRLAERNVAKLQTHLKGVLVRRHVAAQRNACRSLVPWAVALQARARGALVRRKWRTKLQALKYSARYVVKVQAQARGVLQRRRYKLLKAALQKISFPVKRLQAASRAHVLRRTQKEIKKEFLSPQITFSVQALQAHARGSLVRRRLRKQIYELDSLEDSVTALQAHCRGLLMRRMVRKQLTRLESLNVVALQAAVRTYLARKRLLQLIRGLRRATSAIVGLQARARAKITRQKHESLRKALVNVQTVKSIGRLQALAKASIVRTQRQQLVKKLDVAMPDVIGIQSAARGALVRVEYHAWRDHLHRSEDVATFLQALLRGVMLRRAFRQKMEYYRANLSKVIKIQSLFRAKETREQYRQLTLGKNVTVGTIKNFVHLLDDSEADFQEEIKVERMRKQVVENIRENQSLENDIHDLDTKIALVVQNLKSFEDVIKARNRQGGESAAQHAARVSLLAAHGDPFSGPNTLDHEARRKLELYQQLFYLLQTRGEYLSRLFVRLSREGTPESSRRFTEHVVLTLFGYGQDRREEFLLLKLFQLAIREEIQRAPSVESVISGNPMYLNIAVQYVRARQVTYVREAFKAIILEVIDADDLDLEADPSAIHRARIDIEEMRSGKPSTQPKELSFREAVVDLGTRPIYIRHMQLLQWWTEAFIKAILMSTKKMSYSMRYLIRETLISLKETFPGYSDEVYGACLARLGFFRYLNPALLAPELFDIVPKTVNITTAKKNLFQIARVLGQIASGVEFGDDQPSYIPVNDFVRKSISQLSAWFIELANVPDAETQFHAHEFMDATVQPKPIYISPNEIYNIHSLLLQNQAHLDSENEDTLKVLLHELGGIPHPDNEELKEARDTAITLELTNRFTTVQDPHAEEKTLWVQAKRGVLAILRVQPGADLFESLMRPVTENDEILWEDIVDAEIANEKSKHPRRQPSAAGPDAAYRLEDIRLLSFAEVKMAAIANLLKLEKMGRITRDDGFQGILNAIAGDVRSKHRKRLQRQQEMESMNEALRQLAQRKKYLLEQIDSYHSFVETSMSTMQKGKGKKRPVLPFTKQYFHLRDLQRTGQSPQFGSFLYSCKKLYDRGILLSIDQYSPRQFDKMQITMSSNHAGVFHLTLESNLLGVTARIASEDIRMEDLLQAKYEKKPSLALFGGKVKVNFELFLFQINKKFYA